MGVSIWWVVACVAVILLPVLWGLARWQTRCSFARLNEWASENGLRILQRTYEPLWHGPFWWRRWYRDLAVYRVVVENPDGSRRTAHVRVSGWFFRPADLTVRWEEES